MNASAITSRGPGRRRWRHPLALLAIACSAGALAQVVKVPEAHLHHAEGTVAHAPPGETEWQDVEPRRVLKRGDRLWTDRGSRAELQAGGHALRMDGGTQLLLENASDTLTQLGLTQGSMAATVTRLNPGDGFEVGTPNLALRVRQPGHYRVDVDPKAATTRVTVLSGSVAVFGAQGEAMELRTAQRATFRDRDLTRVDAGAFARMDDFDRWAAARSRGEPTVRMPPLSAVAQPGPAAPSPSGRTIVIAGPASALPGARAAAVPPDARVAAAPPGARPGAATAASAATTATTATTAGPAAHQPVPLRVSAPLAAVPLGRAAATPAGAGAGRSDKGSAPVQRHEAQDRTGAQAAPSSWKTKPASRAEMPRDAGRRTEAAANAAAAPQGKQQQGAEEQHRAQAARQAGQAQGAQARRATEATRAEQQRRQAAQARRAEQARGEAQARQAAAQKRLAQAKKAEQERRLAQARKVEQERLAQQRRIETQRIAAEARRRQLERLQAQAAREQQAARNAQARREHQARQEEEARRAEEQRALAAQREAAAQRQRELADQWRREHEVWLRQVQPDQPVRPAPMGVPVRRVS